MEERFLFCRVDANDLYMFRWVVRYGYTDVQFEEETFERLLVERLKDNGDMVFGELQDGLIDGKHINEERRQEDVDKDIEAIDKGARPGVVHLISENELMAEKGSRLREKVLINVGYNILKKNLRLTDIGHSTEKVMVHDSVIRPVV
ncbi:hypothetical protein PVL29_008583 [Vitis rotundifolia]|uniref:Uncharacterized protein n=1 Tax=Vitis rotundifolia TaxID=103349 RepID=A0AA38ZX65_VITRO|nr:hypothetical protein PVL29_008583 [Vitis rotundifolia]